MATVQMGRVFKSTLESMVVAKIDRSTVGEFRKLGRLGGEKKLEFLTRTYLIFQAICHEGEKKDNVSTLFAEVTPKC